MQVDGLSDWNALSDFDKSTKKKSGEGADGMKVPYFAEIGDEGSQMLLSGKYDFNYEGEPSQYPPACKDSRVANRLTGRRLKQQRPQAFDSINLYYTGNHRYMYTRY